MHTLGHMYHGHLCSSSIGQTLAHLTFPTGADTPAGGHSAAHPFAHSRAPHPHPPLPRAYKKVASEHSESHLPKRS